MLVFTISLITKFSHKLVGIRNKLVHKINMSQDGNCLYETGVVLGYSWNRRCSSYLYVQRVFINYRISQCAQYLWVLNMWVPKIV